MVLSVLCLKPRREPQTDKGGKTAVEFLAISNSPGSIVPSTSRQPFMNGGHRHYATTCWGTIRAHTSSPRVPGLPGLGSADVMENLSSSFTGRVLVN